MAATAVRGIRLLASGRASCGGSTESDVGLASSAGAEGLVDDDLAFVLPWGFSVADIVTPFSTRRWSESVRCRLPARATWLLQNTPEAEGVAAALDVRIAILGACAVVLDWLHSLL
ncbi:hypothetical protein [Cryobacterium sp. Y29]|uniref:hypothetical protein n=1 Tax=Cryobacterium sp. Y29 TaxID=2048285 RepID=UPI000CE49635|nr:hypothetical protein [Cryobacterium sp. Y29]